ncbi:translation initiation factor IF-2-like [Cebus imitator]|uniref:translation initiation factor IF-2-like n=1 Tax=Cebus imitator TaxID=2715852 RepID=UPI00189A583E|nr:translation initiation factor IF-2-like [Cebus imitator]
MESRSWPDYEGAVTLGQIGKNGFDVQGKEKKDSRAETLDLLEGAEPEAGHKSSLRRREDLLYAMEGGQEGAEPGGTGQPAVGGAQAAAGPRAPVGRGGDPLSQTIPGRAPASEPRQAPNSVQRPQVGGPRPAPAGPRLPRRGPPAEPEGSGVGPGAAAALRPPRRRSLSAPLPPPAAGRTLPARADPAGPGAGSLPAAEPSPPPAARSAARLRPDDPSGGGGGSGGGDPPPALSARLLRALPPPPALLPGRAVTPPRGRPRPRRAGRGPETHLGRPPPPPVSASGSRHVFSPSSRPRHFLKGEETRPLLPHRHPGQPQPVESWLHTRGAEPEEELSEWAPRSVDVNALRAGAKPGFPVQS